MIIRELPRLPSGKNVSLPSPENKIICTITKDKYQYPNHTTPYLLIANFLDTGDYLLNSRDISVNQKLFYFLNAGDNLEINFKNRAALETVFIMFSDEFIKGWFGYRHSDIASLLENGKATAVGNWGIPNIPFEYNTDIIHQLSKIRAYDQGEDMDEILFELLDSFWVLKEGADRGLGLIDVKRKSTKEEIYKRLLAAKIFMHEHYTVSPTIDAIASEACLDKFHFLKLFKGLYGITPHQYLVKLKLEHAYRLLATGRFTVIQVCDSVGFESLGSFSNLFRKYYHLSPSALSKRHVI